ncbi:MAG: DUF3604 domain-containing protein [Gammaproteobacteria bacterium]|jgi:hypothetical protein|nr:DUF3604 domain-containing protein [Gammaproteobacteria bacterium]
MLVKLLKIVITLVAVIAIGGALTIYFWFQGQREPFTDAALERDLAKQRESAVVVPAPRLDRLSDNAPQPNANRNLYFGELHLHTDQSFDSLLFGNRLSIDDAYRFARGEKLVSNGLEPMQLSRPLDFVAITDHAEGFGSRRHCGESGLPLKLQFSCWILHTPNMATFKFLRGEGGGGNSKPERANSPYCRAVGLEQCLADARADWADFKALADKYNVPGVFTAIQAYEYSPTLPDYGKYHRNVFFRGDNLPDFAMSALDAPTEIDLWKSLELNCAEDCEFLTIPHNTNRAWGLPYGPVTRYGHKYTPADWALRAESEPLTEIYQIKGASECALGANATDEECGFEQVFAPCRPGQETACAFPTGFVREGLKIGMQLERTVGINPFQTGIIAATDSHNANPGDTEEWDYRGMAAAVSGPAIRRQKHLEPGMSIHRSQLAAYSPGGLAAVWATENTRDALFRAMQAREAYGTSGTRIQLRFFAGWNLADDILASVDPISEAYAGGVPMGGVLNPGTDAAAPAFLVWAMADPLSAPLQRVQMIKGWLDATGESHEQVVDIACADGLLPDAQSGRCPDNGASVDMSNCQVSTDKGAAELKVLWRDPQFDASQSAFYYVRVLQNPTCRWSSYDALRLGIEPTAHAAPTIRERAWSSPIWYKP